MLGVAILATPLIAGEAAPAVEQVILVGDSTVATKSGWGDVFMELLGPGATFVNMARGERSSKSYRDEGHWQKVVDAKPTWVLIQFGHNDQPGKGPKRETDAKTTFRENLARYVNEARAMGAKPVLVTSLTRRNFNAQGKIEPAHPEPSTDKQGENSPDVLKDYVEGTKAVAAELKVPLIDLNARRIEQMNQLGPEAAKTFDATKTDKTHLSQKGAAETAMSIPRLDTEELFRLGQAIAPLRDEGVLIFGSGFLTHNMQYAYRPGVPQWAHEFDHWAEDALSHMDVDALLDFKSRAPAAKIALPTWEHYAPVLVAAGAVVNERPLATFPITGWWMDGAFTKRSVHFG